MSLSSRLDGLLGLVLPLSLLAGLAAVGASTGRPGVVIAAMAAVPILTALLTTLITTAIVAVAAVITAALTAALSLGQAFSEAIPVLMGVIVAGGVAVLVSGMRVTARRPSPERGASRARTSSRVVGRALSAKGTGDLSGLPSRDGVLGTYAGEAAHGTHVVAVLGIDDLAGTTAARGSAVSEVVVFAVGGRTRYALNRGDTVARWSDDEFLLVVVGDLATSTPTLELITDKVNKNPIRTDSGPVPTTVSMGAALWPEGTEFAEACAEAARALQAARTRGGACLVVSDPPTA